MPSQAAGRWDGQPRGTTAGRDDRVGEIVARPVTWGLGDTPRVSRELSASDNKRDVVSEHVSGHMPMPGGPLLGLGEASSG